VTDPRPRMRLLITSCRSAIETHSYSRIADVGPQDARCCVAVLGPADSRIHNAKKVVTVNIEDPFSRPGWTCRPSRLSPVSLAKA
jgi:hypothetical protein